MKYCGICRTDIHIAEGDVPLHKRPVILGHEVVGVVDKLGEDVEKFKTGDLVGVTWLYKSCGSCEYCVNGLENYCPHIVRTGWDVNGGYADYMVAYEDYVLPLNNIPLDPEDLAPLMCPGVASYLCYKLASPEPGDRIGIIGFGPTAYYLLKTANFLGVDVYISTRSKHHREIATEYGAKWVGNILEEDFPVKMNHIISFPPVGNIVEKALENLKPSGNLVLAQVASTPIVINNYKNLWGKNIKTVYNVRRSTSLEMLELAKKIDFSIDKKMFDFEELQDAMIMNRQGEVKELTSVLKIG